MVALKVLNSSSTTVRPPAGRGRGRFARQQKQAGFVRCFNYVNIHRDVSILEKLTDRSDNTSYSDHVLSEE